MLLPQQIFSDLLYTVLLMSDKIISIFVKGINPYPLVDLLRCLAVGGSKLALFLLLLYLVLFLFKLFHFLQKHPVVCEVSAKIQRFLFVHL